MNASQKYRKTRAELIARGYTIVRWARERGFSPSTAYMALRGQRHGVKAAAIMAAATQFIKSEAA